MDPAALSHSDPSSLINVSEYTNGDNDPLGDVDSLPESEPTLSDGDEEESDAEREWKESLQQLELLLTMVIVPYAGKYFGRKFAYWGAYSCLRWNGKEVWHMDANC